MTRLTLRQMQYFQRLAELLHFGRAASACGVTQPALSAQISEMEAQLGFRLFERGGGTVRLTQEAQELRPRIERILAEVEDLEQVARRDRNALEDRFRLGVIPTVAPFLLPRLLPRLKLDFPALRLEIREAVTAALIEETNGGRLDGMIAAAPIDAPQLKCETLFDDPFYLAVPEADARRIAPPVTQESVALERLMLLEDGHCMRAQALAVCGMVKPVTMASFGATSLMTLLQLVAHGFGVTLIPEMARESAEMQHGVRVLPFRAPAPSRTICLAWRKTNPRGTDFSALSKTIKDLYQKNQ
ncbi:hydrogen peroxide-inducible genes activator [Chelativorans sp. AA-79]|uniref:hydrogen peroxide-inducible genes activator n=1 Tax=Chelativorans sp. AA-79 TaxID=3028735 RepID=UPI0023F675CA|nr:hydrogen peroxide-inducible genes activator [Chelativorans sp. AA-79]WEX09124.1 hydrogen peroxide-inducible genes activator [Chelativorans sp. AA-79]